MSKKNKAIDITSSNSSTENSHSIYDHIGKELTEKLNDLFDNIKKNDEFEFMFFGRKGKYLSQEKYIQLLKFLTKRAEKNGNKSLPPDDTLDIVFQPNMETNIRCTLHGTTKINTLMKKVSMWKNHVVLKTLTSMWKKKEEGISLMKKEKNAEQVVDIDELDLRARLSKESDLSKDEINDLISLDETNMNKIKYRYKQRTSFYVDGDEDTEDFIRIDLTYTKMSYLFKDLNQNIPNYELEIEYGTKKTPNREKLNKMLKEVELLLKIIQQSNFIITKQTANQVISYYKSMMSIPDNNTLLSLDARQTVTLEIQHVTELLPNKYAVTDKADGERFHLIIYENKVYLISTNIDVKFTGIILNNDEYNGSIIDGELIFISRKNRHIFLGFDCLFHKSVDIRTKIKLFDRIKYIDDIVQNCFLFGKQKGYSYDTKFENTKFDLNKILDNHFNEIKIMMENLNNDIELEKQYPLIRRKFFIGATGGKDWEIFAYASLLWTAFTNSADIHCPYLLDGLIFQPLEQAYVTNAKDSKLSDYKWKPPEKNSIDFYMEYEKDANGKPYVVYDNSYDDLGFVRNKPYKICKLHVGQRNKNVEVPILFKEQEELYLAYIFLDKGEVRDIEGNILSDKTVIECYYNNDPDVLDKFKWVPIRTRYDKTESVIRHKRKYGNYVTVADKVWRSIKNPILMSDFEDLAIGNNPAKNNYAYDKKIAAFKKKIGHELIISATKESSYFQQTSNIAKPMRQFQNWVKDNMIYTFCHPMYQDNKQLSVLDIACGRGADILKFYFSKVAFLVGIDIDRDGLVSAVNGAISRYNQMKPNYPNFPQMHWIQADATAEFDLESQKKALNLTHIEGESSFVKFFSKEPNKRTTFDRINCQFAIHYMLRNDDTWKNFKTNLNNYLRNGGYCMFSCFDGDKIRQLLKGKDNFTQEYTDENGKSKILFDIIKKYEDVDDNIILGTGHAIDAYISWFSQEGRYLTEYLVDSRFLVKDLKESCDLELVNTDNFHNQYFIHEKYLTYAAKFEDEPRTRKFLAGVADFYKSDSMNDGSKIWNSLFRYYVFRKGDGKKQKGGNNENILADLSDTSKFVVPSMNETGYDNEYSCINSIHHILRKHHIIPKDVNPKEFCSDIGVKYLSDHFINDEIGKIARKTVVKHKVEKQNKFELENVLDGINIFLVERNCNDEYDVELVNLKKNNKIDKNDDSIILMKEGSFYVPVYHLDPESNKRIGIFKGNDKIVKKLLSDV